MSRSRETELPALPLPPEITSRYIDCVATGLIHHILEAGCPASSSESRPIIVFLHGFPELAYSWRKVMPIFAAAGYHVIAPDQRGLGRTTGWGDNTYSGADLASFTQIRMVRDVICLLQTLGHPKVGCVIGHDFGAVVASLCALIRPDMFRSLVLASHPFKGIPHVHANEGARRDTIHEDLAALQDSRKLYKWYYATPEANEDMLSAPGGLRHFLRGYFHLKSADWRFNQPHPLSEWKASELAKLPHYYTMPLHSTMGEVVKHGTDEDSENLGKGLRWLNDEELGVYEMEHQRTGFQGGLNWYRVATDPEKWGKDLQVFAGKTIDVPYLFISGAQDWGNYQEPGVLEKQSSVSTKFHGMKMIPGAGHWVQQEQSEIFADEVLRFLKEITI